MQERVLASPGGGDPVRVPPSFFCEEMSAITRPHLDGPCTQSQLLMEMMAISSKDTPTIQVLLVGGV